MFVELLDRLRCPNAHEDFPLVASSFRTVDRRIIEGVLGCPACGAEYPIHDGAVAFGGAVAPPPLGASAPHDDEATIRLAALLGLDERGGIYVLDYTSALFTPALAALAPAAQFIVISGGDDIEGAGIVLRGRGSVLPLARGCARGIVLDDGADDLLRSAVAALGPGGRLVAPAAAALPEGVKLLARDDDQWVGEREAVPVLSVLRRAR
jgi:uncharacterized protein YbaR (Trm112 family)